MGENRIEQSQVSHIDMVRGEPTVDKMISSSFRGFFMTFSTLPISALFFIRKSFWKSFLRLSTTMHCVVYQFHKLAASPSQVERREMNKNSMRVIFEFNFFEALKRIGVCSDLISTDMGLCLIFKGLRKGMLHILLPALCHISWENLTAMMLEANDHRSH
jgi:hypothetical protein